MPRFDPIEWAKSNLFDTSTWGPFCDVTLTLRQGRWTDRCVWTKIGDYPCRRAFQHFMNLLTGRYTVQRFADTASVFGFCPYLNEARSAPAHYVHGSLGHRVDGMFIVRLSCRPMSMRLRLKN
jgi:hypothetical protein